MAKRKQKKSFRKSDNIFFLKLTVLVIVSSLWIKITKGTAYQIPIPLGFIAALIFIMQERFSTDKKIEFAVLLMAMMGGFWLPIGLYIAL